MVGALQPFPGSIKPQTAMEAQRIQLPAGATVFSQELSVTICACQHFFRIVVVEQAEDRSTSASSQSLR